MKIDGWKTYLVSLALLAFAVGGFFAGKIEINQALEIIGMALGFGALRHGVGKAEVKK